MSVIISVRMINILANCFRILETFRSLLQKQMFGIKFLALLLGEIPTDLMYIVILLFNTLKILYFDMLLAPKSTMQINSFVCTCLPSPRDYYARYGFRQSAGVYMTDSETPSDSVDFCEIPAHSVARADSLLRKSFSSETEQ